MTAFLWSPVRFFSARLAEPPRWLLAVAPLVACTLLDAGAVYTLGGKVVAAMSGAAGLGAMPDATLRAARWSSLTTVMGYPACVAVSVVIMASLDALTVDSGRQRRYADLAGLASAAFIPGCVLALVASVMWSPPLVFATDADSMSRYMTHIRTDPWLSTSRLVYYFGLLWYTTLLAIILKASGVLSTRTATAAALGLFVSLGGFRLLQFLPPLTRW